MKKRVTVIIALLVCLVLAVCLFAACNDGGSTGQQTPGGNRPGAETPGDESSGVETPGENPSDNPGNNPGGEDPGTDEPGDSPDGEEQEPDGGQSPSGDEPETSEPTEEDYRLQNLELLKEILAREYNQFTRTEYSYFTLHNIDNIIVNSAAEEVYFTADMSGITGGILGNFFITGSFGQSFDWQSQKEFNEFLISFNESDSNMTFDESKSLMSNQVSETTYAEFIDWVKEQDYGEADFSDVPNDDIFGVTWFIRDNDALGYRYIGYKIIKDEQIYTIHLENVDPLGSPNTQIKELMKWKNSVFKIVDVKPFEEFDINTEIKDIA